jgi:uncharacterized protein (TIGR02246 family)
MRATRAREHIGAARALVAAALAVGLASLLDGCAARCGALANDPADVAAIRATLDAQTAAWNRGDVHAFVAGYALSPQRMTFVGSKGVIVRGRDALEERYRKSYPAGRQGTLTFDELEVSRLGPDDYLVVGRWALARPPDDPHGVFSLVFERAAAGDGERRLEIVHDHSSSAAE